MRQLRIFEHISLDGVIQVRGPGDDDYPYFAEGTPPRAFELASAKALPSGIVINACQAAGPLKNQP